MIDRPVLYVVNNGAIIVVQWKSKIELSHRYPSVCNQCVCATVLEAIPSSSISINYCARYEGSSRQNGQGWWFLWSRLDRRGSKFCWSTYWSWIRVIFIGHSNWIISFPLIACMATLHLHVLILSRYFLLLIRNCFILSYISYYWKEYFSFVCGDGLSCYLYINKSAFLEF